VATAQSLMIGKSTQNVWMLIQSYFSVKLMMLCKLNVRFVSVWVAQSEAFVWKMVGLISGAFGEVLLLQNEIGYAKRSSYLKTLKIKEKLFA
jgi:hypothetical protein